MTALNTPIVFSSTGSDSQMSGSPSTRLIPSTLTLQITSGSNVAYGSASGAVNVGDLVYAPNQTSGRKFNVVASINTSTFPYEYTFDDNWDASDFSATCYSGGKRATFDNADSRQAFEDSEGWTFETETDQTITSTIDCPPANGSHYFRGSAGSIKTITNSSDSASFEGNANNNAVIFFSNLKFDNSASTKTSARAIIMRRIFHCSDCVFGDATNQLRNGVSRAADFPNGTFWRCVFQHCTEDGLRSTLSYGYTINQCVFRDNTLSGMKTAQHSMWVFDSLFYGNGEDGWHRDIGNPRQCVVRGNVFYGNTRDGIGANNLHGFSNLSDCSYNIIAENGRYGWKMGAFETGANTNGNAFFNNATADIHGSTPVYWGEDLTLQVSPFVDPTASPPDFNLNNALGGGATLRNTKFTLGG